MGRPPGRGEVHAKRALLPDGQAVFGRLAVDEKTAAGTEIGRRPGAVGPVLLADHEEEPDPALAPGGQPLRGRHHRRRQALGVAAAPSPDRDLVLHQRQVGRDGVHVGREDQLRRLPVGVQVVPAARDRLARGPIPGAPEDPLEEVDRRLLRAGRCFQRHEGARQLQRVHECKRPACAWHGGASRSKDGRDVPRPVGARRVCGA